MSTVLQWMALAVSLACAGWRLPAAVKGRNTSLFWMFVLLTVAVGLSIPAIYLTVDGWLGGVNVANLLIRFSLYAIFFILASKMAAAHRSRRSQWLIRGPVGLAALGLVAAATLVFFVISDLPVSNTGLAGYSEQWSVQGYAVAGRLYPAYAAAVLVGPTAAAARTAARAINRASAALLCLAFIMVVLATLAQISTLPLKPFIDVMSYGSIVCVAAGLALVWASFRGRPHAPPVKRPAAQ